MKVPVVLPGVLLALLVAAIIVLLFILYRIRSRNQCVEKQKATRRTPPILSDIGTKIPLVIWTYWNNDVLPPFISACVDSWKRHCPEFKVNVITPSNLATYLPLDVKGLHWNDGPTRESDIIRINIIERYGGVWSDASIVLHGPYPCLKELTSGDYEFVGYEIRSFNTDVRYPVLENWWFASIAGGRLIKAWRNAFMDVKDTQTVRSRADELMQTYGTNPQKLFCPYYLYMHLVAQYVLQKQMSPPGDLSALKMYVMIAEQGPFKYLSDNAWDIAAGLRQLKSEKAGISTIHKLRGLDRVVAEEDINWLDLF